MCKGQFNATFYNEEREAFGDKIPVKVTSAENQKIIKVSITMEELDM